MVSLLKFKSLKSFCINFKSSMSTLPVDEPFGMVFTEAMAQGLLCIGPDHGGPHEILEGGAVGWAVDAFSAEQVARALEHVAGLSDGEADRRRRAALASVRGRFSAEAMVKAIGRVVKEAGGPGW